MYGFAVPLLHNEGIWRTDAWVEQAKRAQILANFQCGIGEVCAPDYFIRILNFVDELSGQTIFLPFDSYHATQMMRLFRRMEVLDKGEERKSSERQKDVNSRNSKGAEENNQAEPIDEL